MSDQVNDETETAPFMIKAMPVASRKLAVACAARAGLTMGPWMDRAVHSQARIDAGENIFPPPSTPAAPAPTHQEVDLASVAAALQAMAAAASAGLPVSKAASREVVALIRENVRVVRGLPPRQTSRRIGQTIDADEG